MKRILAVLLAVLLVLPVMAVMNVTAIGENEWNSLWLTHYNNHAVEASGVIITSQDYNTSQAWRLVIAFAPINGNYYEIVEIKDYLGTADGVINADVPDGGFLYLLNKGNDYTATGGVKYINANCDAAIADAYNWQVGDVFQFTNLNLESLVAPTTTPSLNWYDSGYVCTAKYRKVADTEELPIESVAVDGNINDSGWTSDGWTIVNGTTGIWQKTFTDKSINAKYQFRSDSNFLYGAFVIYNPPVAGTGNGSATNLRLWFNTTNAAKYTSYYDFYYNGSSAGINTSVTGSTASAKGVAAANSFTVEFSIPFAEIGAANIDQIPYYVSISTNNGSEEPCLYYPKMSSYSSPLSSWLKNCDGDLSKYDVMLNNFEFVLSSDSSYYILQSIGTYGSKNITVPSSYNGLPVKEIASRAFAQSEITSVILPDTMVTIGQAAFGQCEQLTTVDLGGTKTIGLGAFGGCSALTAINLEAVTEIGAIAFSSCSALEVVRIPATVAVVGSNAFSFCENLTDIYCEAEAKPDSWDDTWANNGKAVVHWNNSTHSHEYGKKWVTNGTHHWHVCSCGDTSDYSEHLPGPWVSQGDGTKYQFCNVCFEVIGIDSTEKILTGDVNADGSIDMFDYFTIKSIYFDTYIPTEDEEKRADIDGSGEIDMFDYLTLKEYLFRK